MIVSHLADINMPCDGQEKQQWLLEHDFINLESIYEYSISVN